MKKSIICLLTTAAFVLTFIMSTSANIYKFTAKAADLTENAYKVAEIVNRERKANGLPLLKYSEKLSQAANLRADEIQTYFSHTRPNGTNCFTAITETGIRYRYAGENIAYGQRSAEEVMKGWMNSPGHRANILSGNFEYIGVGVSERNGIYYWTQFFASSDDLEGETFTETTVPAETAFTATNAVTTVTASIETTSASISTVTVPCSTRKRPQYFYMKKLLMSYGINIDDILKCSS